MSDQTAQDPDLTDVSAFAVAAVCGLEILGVAAYSIDNDLTLKAATLELGFVTEADFDCVVDPKKWSSPTWQLAPSHKRDCEKRI
jgi:fumarate hydratase class II